LKNENEKSFKRGIKKRRRRRGLPTQEGANPRLIKEGISFPGKQRKGKKRIKKGLLRRSGANFFKKAFKNSSE